MTTNRYRLKNGGRKKAFWGAAISAAATLAAAAMQSKATADAAKEQSRAMIDNAQTQAKSIQQQSDNNTKLQKENIEFTRSQNALNREQQQGIQTTLQLLAGQANMNDRLNASKMQVKYGGRPRRKLKYPHTIYGGSGLPFEVTDGGGALPIQIDSNGYGLYELYGNDHDHYHKTRNGKRKTGVGIKFEDGSVVEGEGNQNSNQGELMYVTPNDAKFISKHNIKGFNPAQAVNAGMHPEDAFNIQEAVKNENGLNDDGSRVRSLKRTPAKCGFRKKAEDGWEWLLNEKGRPYDVVFPPNAFVNGEVQDGIYGEINHPSLYDENKNYIGPQVFPGDQYGNSDYYFTKAGTWGTKDNSQLGILPEFTITAKAPKKQKPKTPSIPKRPKLLAGDYKSFWDNPYVGAGISSVGNIGGAALSTWGNISAGKTLSNAYTQSGNILANAYRNLKTIDTNLINQNDYASAHAMAAVRSADTNINPQLERLRRNAVEAKRSINRGTLSSAARQQRLADINDKTFQSMGEQYSWKQNQDEAIKQERNKLITEVANENANRDVQSRRDYTTAKLDLLKYNNDIVNQRISGEAQALADANIQSANVRATANQASANAFSSALSASGQAFGTAFDTQQKYQHDIDMLNARLDTKDKIDVWMQNGDINKLQKFVDMYSNAPSYKEYVDIVNDYLLKNTLPNHKPKIPTNYDDIY